jgi:hypothetical protein
VAALGVDRYGESAPAADLFEHFGLTVEHLVRLVERTVSASCSALAPAPAPTEVALS